MKDKNKNLGDYYQYAQFGFGIDAVAEIEKTMNSMFDNVVEDWHNEKYNQIIAKDCSDKIYQNEPTVSLETKPEVSPYMILI